MAYEGEFSRALSDEERGALRGVAHATVHLPQDLVVAAGPEHGLPKGTPSALMPTSGPARWRICRGARADASVGPKIFTHRDGADPRTSARLRSRTSETGTAPHNPERKLS